MRTSSCNFPTISRLSCFATPLSVRCPTPSDALLNDGVDLNAANDENNALMLAIEKKDAALVRKLVEAGAKPDLFCHRKNYPLIKAVRSGNAEIVKILIDAGADVNEKQSLESAIEYAARWNRHEIIPLLLEAGAEQRYRALQVALVCEKMEAARALYDKDIASHIQEKRDHVYDWVYDFCAAAFVGDEDAVRRALQAGAKPDVMATLKIDYEMYKRMVPIMFAAMAGQTGVIKLLAEAGADVDKSFHQGAYDEDYMDYNSTALMLASMNGYADAVRCLIDAGASVNKFDKHYHTALYYARDGKHHEVVEVLLNAGAKK